MRVTIYVLVMWISVLKVVRLCLILAGLLRMTNGIMPEKGSTVTTNWAVLVCSSRYWFNYRHFANTLSVYNLLKSKGYEDDHIIFMSSMEPAFDARNPSPGEILASKVKGNSVKNRYDENVEVDFRGPECNVESFSRLLTGRLSSDTPVRKTLQTDENSNILMYMTGHGGDEFFKFHDTQEISSQDMGYLLRDMYAKNRYKEVLLIVDTCQASTFSNHIDVPGVYTLTSSVQGENSYAHDTNVDLAMAVSDRFTHSLVEYLQRKGERRKKKGTEVGAMDSSLLDLARSFDRRFLYSTATLQVSPGSKRRPVDIALRDFFTYTSRSACGNTTSWTRMKHGALTLETTGKNGKKKDPISFERWLEALPE